MDTYTTSKGDTILIKDMLNPHLIHSIAKLAGAIAHMDPSFEETTEQVELLKALKSEAINRLNPTE